MSRYSIKVVGDPKAGEYDGADSIPAAVRRAKREFVPYVGRNAAVYVVRFSKDGLRVIHVRTVKESGPIGGYASRRASRYGNVHPEFPRVVVYLFRADGGIHVIAKAKDDYHAKWRIAARRSYKTVSAGRAGADKLGRSLEKWLKTPGAYELVHGAPPEARR